MAVWDRKLGELCVKNSIKMKSRKRYVDDCNAAMEGWRKGWRWATSKMLWKKKWEEEDVEMDEPDDTRCWREWGKMASSIWPFIQVTVDCPGMNSDGFVPILDLKCRMEEVEEEGVTYKVIVWRF